MGLLSQVSSQRRKQIVSYAEPHLFGTDEVLHYVRSRDPETNRKGFVYLTPTGLVVAWKHDGGTWVRWDDIAAWGLKHDGHSPVLRVEWPDQILEVELRTASRAMTAGVREFLRDMSELVPSTAGEVGAEGYRRPSHAEVSRRPTSPGQLAKRIMITTLGVALVVLAVAIIPLPGPWSFLIIIAGLAILATEYDWAEDALDWAKSKYQAARDRFKARRA